jgi:alkylation response protein AidB-like acyl-CoA dehydrogenase
VPEQTALRVARERASETEAGGHLHPAVTKALTEAGMLRRWVAAECGGEAATVTQVLRTIEATSQADGAAGWCVMIANTTALTSHRMRSDWADTIYRDPAACTGGFGMPAGTATVVEGGLEVTGQWAWGSGTDHCSWIGGGVRVVDQHGEPAVTSDGAFAPFVFFEPTDVQLLDTWHVSGLKGTASTDYAVTRAFVPEGRWANLLNNSPVVDSPLGHFPFFGALGAGVAACLIGLGERAIEEIILLSEKRSTGSKKSLAERATLQAGLATAIANVRQARSYLYGSTDAIWDRSVAGTPVSDDDRVELRLAATSAAQRCVEAVDLCYHAAGSSAVYETSALQRVFRDAHVAITHGMVAPRTMEPLGRYLFGLPTNTAQF